MCQPSYHKKFGAPRQAIQRSSGIRIKPGYSTIIAIFLKLGVKQVHDIGNVGVATFIEHHKYHFEKTISYTIEGMLYSMDVRKI